MVRLRSLGLDSGYTVVGSSVDFDLSRVGWERSSRLRHGRWCDYSGWR